MDKNLVKRGSSELLNHTPSKGLQRAAKVIHEEVRVEGLKIDGSLALAGHAMEGLIDLDNLRRTLAGADETTNQILAEVELEAVRQVKRIQSGLFNEWGL